MSINLQDLNLSREDKLSLLEQLKEELKPSKNNLRSGQYLCVIGYDEAWKNVQKYNWLWEGCLDSDSRVFIIQDNKHSGMRRIKEGAYHFNDVWVKGNYQYYAPSFKPIFKIKER